MRDIKEIVDELDARVHSGERLDMIRPFILRETMINDQDYDHKDRSFLFSYFHDLSCYIAAKDYPMAKVRNNEAN